MSDKSRHESLQRLMKAANVDGPSALASALNESEQTVTNWGRRGVSKQGAIKAQGKFGCSVEWILDGKGREHMESQSAPVMPADDVWPAGYAERLKIENFGNVDVARAFTGEVPVISWVQAGSWNEASDPFQPGEAERYLPIFRGRSSSTFALKVRGDSMTAPHGKSYPEGSYIIVDPAKLSPVNGDRIIAKLDGSDEVTFKVFKNEDGRKWLAPLNTSHIPIIQPFKVIGTVIGKWEDE